MVRFLLEHGASVTAVTKVTVLFVVVTVVILLSFSLNVKVTTCFLLNLFLAKTSKLEITAVAVSLYRMKRIAHAKNEETL